MCTGSIFCILSALFLISGAFLLRDEGNVLRCSDVPTNKLLKGDINDYRNIFMMLV